MSYDNTFSTYSVTLGKTVQAEACLTLWWFHEKSLSVADKPCPSSPKKSKKRKKESTPSGGRLPVLALNTTGIIRGVLWHLTSLISRVYFGI